MIFAESSLINAHSYAGPNVRSVEPRLSVSRARSVGRMSAASSALCRTRARFDGSALLTRPTLAVLWTYGGGLHYRFLVIGAKD